MSNQNILNEFEDSDVIKDKYKNVLDKLDLIYLLLVWVFLIIKHFHYNDPITGNLGNKLLFLLLLPLLIWYLYYKRKWIGWLLRSLYYSFFSTIMVFLLLKKGPEWFVTGGIGLAIFFLSFIIALSGFRKPALIEYRIKPAIIICILIFIAFISFMFYISILKSN